MVIITRTNFNSWSFEEATRYLGGEKYVTHSIMHPIIKEIKRLLTASSTNSLHSPPPASPSTSIALSDIYLEIANADDVFVVIEQVEMVENQEIISNNNQRRQNNRINLNQPLETNNKLVKVKKRSL